MSDDLFDQLVDEVLADEDSAAAESSDDDESDFDLNADGLLGPGSQPVGGDDPIPLVDDDDEPGVSESAAIASDDPTANPPEDDGSKSAMVVTTDDEPMPAPAETADFSDKDKAKPKSKPEGKSGKPKKKVSSKVASLPLCTSTEFAHPGYTMAQSLSLVSARRVVGTSNIAPPDGRSKEGEKLVAVVEQDLKFELRRLAVEKGGHAVIGVSISLVSAGGLLFAHASGTPIKLKKKDS